MREMLYPVWDGKFPEGHRGGINDCNSIDYYCGMVLPEDSRVSESPGGRAKSQIPRLPPQIF